MSLDLVQPRLRHDIFCVSQQRQLPLSYRINYFLSHSLDNDDDDDDSGSDNERDSDDDGDIDVDGAVKSCPVQKFVITLNEMNNNVSKPLHLQVNCTYGTVI